MAKLYDKDDPNQVKEDQAPYGDDADESVNDDPSPAAVHGRVVRLETNARHVASQKDIARVEGKIDEAKAEAKAGNARLEGKIDTVNAELGGKIDTVSAENKAGIARVEGKVDTVNAELGGKIDEAKAEAKADNAEVKGDIKELRAENAWNRRLLYTIIAFLAVEFAKDNQTIASIIHFLANFFR